MLIPVLLLLVLVALAANYAYVLVGRRSRARVSLRGVVPLVRQRHALLEKLASGEGLPPGGTALHADLLQASDACREAVRVQPDETLVEADNAFTVQAEALFRTAGDLPSSWVTRWESLRHDFDVEAGQYNRLVRRYNDSLGRFPGNWVGRALRLRPLPAMRRG